MEKQIVTPEFIKRTDVYNACLGGYGGSSVYMPVYQFDLEGNYIQEWDSMQEIADFYCTSHCSIFRAVHFKRSYQNFYWSHNKTININEFTNYIKGTVVYKYDGETGKFLCEYSSMLEAARDTNILIQQVQSAVKCGYKANGFYFSTKVFDEYFGTPKISIKNIPIYAYTLNGEFVKELNGSAEICKFLNAKFINAVTTAMRANRPYHGYQLSIEKKDRLDPVVDKRNIKKPIGRYDLSGKLLQQYNSITEAQEIYGSGVRRVLKGQQKQCHGFIFKYL